MHIASHYGNVNVGRLLIDRSADVNYKARVILSLDTFIQFYYPADIYIIHHLAPLLLMQSVLWARQIAQADKYQQLYEQKLILQMNL